LRGSFGALPPSFLKNACAPHALAPIAAGMCSTDVTRRSRSYHSWTSDKIAFQFERRWFTKQNSRSEKFDNLFLIATLWSAKGVTADHVYVLGLNSEMIPGKRRDDYPGTDAEYYDEQKRLFYVTLTRSKKTLVLSRSQKLKRQEARSMGISVDNPGSLWPSLNVSPFLSQVMNRLPDGVQGGDWTGC
jgi:hypothetical protein